MCIFSIVCLLAALPSAMVGSPPQQQLGLHVRDGVLMKDGRPYRGVGANYFSLFARMIQDPSDNSSLTNLKALSRAGIPFVRFMCCGFWPVDQKLYLTDRAEYFRRLDQVVRCGEENHIGLIPSLFWHVPTTADIVGEHLDEYGDPDSKSIAFIRRYTEEVVRRYGNSPAIWGWEFGNEYNLAADLPNHELHRPDCWPALGTPRNRTARDELEFPQFRSALVAFAETVRKFDKTRIVISGNSIPRSSAWHNLHEKSWTQDTESQFAEILLRDNPDPIDTICVHVYRDAKGLYSGGARTIDEAVGVANQYALRAGKPLFLGEFGAERQLGTPQQQRAVFEEFLQAIDRHRVPLAAFWVFDLPAQEKTYNVDFQNDRSYMIERVSQLNAKMIVVAAAAGTWRPAGAEAEEVSLAGAWRFALGPGIHNAADRLPKLDLADTIQLPGTTDENHKGQENTAREPGRLTRIHPYEGPAWYQREIVVPEDWRGKRIALFLERTKYTAAWVDDQPLGDQDSLACPHVYDLSALLTPGTHRLTVLVDNAKKPLVGDPHQLSEHTQTNWNGIIGRVELRVTPPVWIDDVQVYPDTAGRKIHVRVKIENRTAKNLDGVLSYHAVCRGPVKINAGRGETKVPLTGATTEIDFDHPMRPSRCWDEFLPEILVLEVDLEAREIHAKVGDVTYRDEASAPFGCREFKAKGTQFTINGRTTFLRGKHDACVFPLTGHPPMELDGWIKYFSTCKHYGINHVRFHTWCPPEAAFAAADRIGIYLQPELPNWRAFDGKSAHDRYLWQEAERIVRTYGNHPSFVMLSLGNEMGGDTAAMAKLVKHLHEIDPRHLYAQGSNNFFWKPKFAEGDEYWTTVRTSADHGVMKSVRGSFATVDAPLGHVQIGPANTMTDYRCSIADVRVPVIGHEVGQYTVFPDFREIAKYTGVLRARNLEIFREKLRAKGMLDQAEQFRQASGRWLYSATGRRSKPRCGRPALAASNSWICRTSPARARPWWAF